MDCKVKQFFTKIDNKPDKSISYRSKSREGKHKTL